MLADPAQASLLGQRLFHHGCRIGKDAVADRPDLALDAIGQLLQTLANELVVVAPQRIARDHRTIGLLEQRLDRPRRLGQVVHARDDHRTGVGVEQRRAAALATVGGHPVHLAVATVVQPGIEALFVAGQFGIGDTHLGKAEFAAPPANLFDQRPGIELALPIIAAMTHAPHYPTVPLYRAASVRELDRLAIENHGIDGYDLMRRAGRRAFEILRGRWPEARTVSICCGGGNNGGDGYVMARLARESGLAVQLIAMKAPDQLSGTAAQAANDWLAAGGMAESPDERLRGDVVVDALLGTGLDRPVRDDYARLIDRINDTGRPVLSVDVPSGLDADTGIPLGRCTRADATVTFIGRKRGLYTGQAGRWCGAVLFDALDTPAATHAAIDADATLLQAGRLHAALPARPADTHKGDLGRLLIVGGNHGMAGAPVLAGRAALRTGSGLVTLATRAAHATLAPALQPELMSSGVETLEDFEPLIESADVLALGPGLGRDDWAQALWNRSVEQDCALVVDADGLNLLAARPTRRGNWILTPHPGEAARLLDTGIAEIQADRFAAAAALAERFDAVVILKGHGSLVAGPGAAAAVCAYGNPAMASAGMGDALTGIVASLLGQGLKPYEAACCGVLAHALAGDRAARGRRQILAGDLIKALAGVLPA